MTTSLTDAYVEVRHPGTAASDPPDMRYGEGDIADVQCSKRGRERKCGGHVVVHNDAGEFTLDGTDPAAVDDRPHLGDRLDLYVQFPSDAAEFGSGAFGGGGHGGNHWRFTGLVRDVEFYTTGPSGSQVGMTFDSFVGGVLSSRLVTDSWEGVQVSGTPTALLDSLMADHAPEVETDRIEAIAETVSYTANNESLFEVVRAIAQRVDLLVWSDRGHLVVHTRETMGADPTVSAGDFTALNVRENSTRVANNIRVNGGSATAVDSLNPATLDVTGGEPYQDGGGDYAPDSYTTVTQTSRVQFRAGTRKARIARIELWTRTTGSNENIVVRVQKDDGTGTAPVAPADASSDIVSHQLGADNELFLDDDGFTTFVLPTHTLPEPRPWVIVETDGSAGQDIGIEADDGNPAHVIRYPYQLAVRQQDPASRATYRRRDATLTRDNIRSLEEAQEIGNQYRNANATPERTVQMDAVSAQAHEIEVGDAIPVSWGARETLATDAELELIERADRLQGNTLTTTLTAEER